MQTIFLQAKITNAIKVESKTKAYDSILFYGIYGV